MKASLAAKLAQLTRRLADLDQLLGAENATADLDSFRRLSREHSDIGPVVALYGDYAAAGRDLAAAQEMLGDGALRDFAQSEIEAARERMAVLEGELQKARTASAAQASPGKDAPGSVRMTDVPFTLKIPDGWSAVNALQIGFLDKLMRTMIFKDQGREAGLVAAFLPKDARLLQVTAGSDTPAIAIVRLNGGTSPAELGVFARKAKQMVQRAMQVIGTVKIDAQSSRDGFVTRWNDATNSSVIDFEGKTNSTAHLLGRAYYVPTRQTTYFIACKFVGETAGRSMEEMD
ncbi:MAG: PCRF domain-containing protein, partial [Lysobacterales bacterium]